jgi:DNA mismatch repair protein MutS2
MTIEPTPVASTATLEALDLPKLLAMLASQAATDLGRDCLLALRPIGDSVALEERRRRYREAAESLIEGALVPIFEEPLAELAEQLDGERCELGGAELLVLAGAVRASAEAAGRVAGSLAEQARELPDLTSWQRRVSRSLDSRGRVRDDASKELRELRRRVVGQRERLYGELRQTADASRELLSEETIPLHEGRLVLLIQASSRSRMPGLVHGRSASGRSLYFEPLAAVEANNRLQEAVFEERAERQRIVNELVTEARQQAAGFRQLLGFLAELDALQAAWRYAGIAEGRLAEIAGDLELRLVATHHPLLDPRLVALRLAALGEEGHTGRSVPVELELRHDRRLVVVTGPNAGGKTVTLKTVGLTVLAHQCGLPVPAAAGTRLPVLQRVMAAVGDEQDLLRDRSTFSGRLQRLGEAWEASGPGNLVLVDEIGSGTDPEEGAALAIALLETLLDEGGLALLTTHLTPLAAAALERDGAWCAAMEFDPETGEPTFRLRPGAPGGSEALSLARRLGLPAAWLERAEELLGAEHRDLRRLLGEVEAVRADLASSELRLRREADRAADERRRLEGERDELAAERKSLSRRLRAELETFQHKVKEGLRDELETMRQAVAAGRRKGLVRDSAERLFADPPLAEEAPPPPPRPLAVGDRVRHHGLGWQGVLRKLAEGGAEVVVGGKRLRCPVAELALIGEEEEGRPSPGAAVETPAASPPPVELKLIGQRVEPALDELDAYLDRALLAALGQVRVIHGHGSGRLRDAVREHLWSHPAVASYRRGRRDEGGNGATIVTLSD